MRKLTPPVVALLAGAALSAALAYATAALDVTLRGQILDLLSELQRTSGMAVLLITHDLNLVRRFADRVAVMEQGVLVEQGTVAQVFGAPQHSYTRRLIASQSWRDVLEVEPPAWSWRPGRSPTAIPLAS